jgi:hypothetical protein
VDDAAGVAARGPLPKAIGIDQGDDVSVIEEGVRRLDADDACADDRDVHGFLQLNRAILAVSFSILWGEITSMNFMPRCGRSVFAEVGVAGRKSAQCTPFESRLLIAPAGPARGTCCRGRGSPLTPAILRRTFGARSRACQ